MKKRIILVLLIVLAALLLCGCGDSNKGQTAALATTTNKMPTVLNQAEYTLYQNIFYNSYAPQYDGKSVTKRGLFTTIKDTYNDTTRYYVWGNLDQTLCCDWQWEFTVEDPSALPSNGSLIEISGVFASDEKALDGYWIKDAKVNTITTYTGTTADVDMTTMSGTLERVQVLNIRHTPEAFDGQSVFAYGRIYDMNNYQDPYYDGSWYSEFSTTETVPAIGTSVILRGTLSNGVISDAKIEVTNN